MILEQQFSVTLPGNTIRIWQLKVYIISVLNHTKQQFLQACITFYKDSFHHPILHFPWLNTYGQTHFTYVSTEIYLINYYETKLWCQSRSTFNLTIKINDLQQLWLVNHSFSHFLSNVLSIYSPHHHCHPAQIQRTALIFPLPHSVSVLLVECWSVHRII